jgi:hypothetical protein
MNLLQVCCTENCNAVVDTDDLSAEEFVELRRLIDLCGIMDSSDTGEELEDETDKVTISVTTADGTHERVFTGSTLSGEARELADYIKYLAKSHQPVFTR